MIGKEAGPDGQPRGNELNLAPLEKDAVVTAAGLQKEFRRQDGTRVLALDSVSQRAAKHREENVSSIRAENIVDEGERPAANTSESQSPKQASDDNPNHVIPVEKLKTIAFHAFVSIGPGSPTDSARYHH